MNKRDEIDPRGLIREAYRIEGIRKPECRSIFLDWAIGLPEAVSPTDCINQLLDTYAKDAKDHPMTEVLTEGLATPVLTGRRGGRSGRR